MANMIMFRDFFNYTINSESSEQTNFPSDNLLLPNKQRRYWKTTGVGNEYVIIDLGSAQTVTGVALINANYDTFVIEGDTTTSFSSPPVTSGTLDTIYDPIRGRYYAYTNPSDYSFNHRYLRLYIPAQTPNDGDTVFKTGGLVIKTGTTEILMNPNYGLTIAINRSSDINNLRSGGVETRNIGERLATMSFTMTRDQRVEADIDEMGNLFSTIDETEDLLVCDNGNFLSKSPDTPFIYVFRRSGGVTFNLSRYPLLEITTLTFLEQI